MRKKNKTPNCYASMCETFLLVNGRAVLSAEDGVDALVAPLELELLAELLAHGGLDGVEDLGEDTEGGGVVLVVVTTLEHTGADQAGVPAVHVTTDDVGGGVVTDHVDVLGEDLLAVDLLHPGGEDLVGVLVGGHLGLAVDDTLEVLAGQSLVHGLEADTEGTLGHAGVRVLSGAEHVTLGEVDGDTLADGVLGHGVETAVLGSQQIDDDLHVGGVVAGVGEDHDSLNVDLGEVARAGGGTLLIGEDAVRGDGRVPCDDIVGDDNVLEAVCLSDLTTLVALTANNEDGLVVVGQSPHGGVGLNELVDADGALDDVGELLTTSGLRLTGSVGDEDVGNLNTQLVVAVQDLENALSFGDETVTVDEDTVNVENESHVLGSLDLLAGEVLDLRSKDLTSGLNRGHARAARLLVGVVNR